MPFVVAGGLELNPTSKLRGYVEARYDFPYLAYSNKQLGNEVSVSQVSFQWACVSKNVTFTESTKTADV